MGSRGSLPLFPSVGSRDRRGRKVRNDARPASFFIVPNAQSNLPIWCPSTRESSRMGAKEAPVTKGKKGRFWAFRGTICARIDCLAPKESQSDLSTTPRRLHVASTPYFAASATRAIIFSRRHPGHRDFHLPKHGSVRFLQDNDSFVMSRCCHFSRTFVR